MAQCTQIRSPGEIHPIGKTSIDFYTPSQVIRPWEKTEFNTGASCSANLAARVGKPTCRSWLLSHGSVVVPRSMTYWGHTIIGTLITSPEVLSGSFHFPPAPRHVTSPRRVSYSLSGVRKSFGDDMRQARHRDGICLRYDNALELVGQTCPTVLQRRRGSACWSKRVTIKQSEVLRGGS